jgi:hypothetical protein
MVIDLLPYLIVAVASYPLMRWARYERSAAFAFVLVSPLVFVVAGGAFLFVAAPLAIRLIRFLSDIGYPETWTQEQVDLLISAVVYVVCFSLICWRIRSESSEEGTANEETGS